MGGSQTANLGSFDGRKITVTQTTDLGSFNGTFQQGGTFGQQTADLGSFNGTFQQRSNVSIKLPTSDSFNGAKLSSLKLQTLAVLMALFSKVTLLVNKLPNLAVLKRTVPCRQDFVRGQILVQDGMIVIKLPISYFYFWSMLPGWGRRYLSHGVLSLSI